MVSPSLDVEGHQVHPEALVLALEEVVGYLLSEDVVVFLSGLSGKSHKKSVEMSGHVDQFWVEESITERQNGQQSSLRLNLINKTENNVIVSNRLVELEVLLQHSLYESVTKSEGGSGEGVEDGGVDVVVILAAVALQDWEDVQLLHVFHSKHNGQPLVVGDVLRQ